MNNSKNLSGKKVAILLTDGFEESEMVKPRKALIKAGAETRLISPKEGKVKSWATDDFGDEYDVDIVLDDANPADYDALLLPGGVMNPDKLRMIPAAVDFVRDFFEHGKPVAAICHGPQMLIEHPDLLSLAQNRSQQRGSAVGGSGGGYGQGPRDQSKTRRYSAIQREDDRGDCGGNPRGSGIVNETRTGPVAVPSGAGGRSCDFVRR